MPDAKTPLAYIRQEMEGLGAFIPDWKELDKKDKDELVSYAKKEMTILGIEIKAPILK